MSNKIKLLSPEVKAKVESKIRECLDIAEKEFKQKFKMPEIRYDIKSHIGGIAISPDFIIRLNLILLTENEDDFIAQTVVHEVAHLVNRKVNKPPEGKKKLMPHGPEWKKIMDLFKIPAEVCHKYDCSSIEKRPRKKQHRKNPIQKVKFLLSHIEKLDEHQMEYFQMHLNEAIQNQQDRN